MDPSCIKTNTWLAQHVTWQKLSYLCRVQCADASQFAEVLKLICKFLDPPPTEKRGLCSTCLNQGMLGSASALRNQGMLGSASTLRTLWKWCCVTSDACIWKAMHLLPGSFGALTLGTAMTEALLFWDYRAEEATCRFSSQRLQLSSLPIANIKSSHKYELSWMFSLQMTATPANICLQLHEKL